MSPPLSNRRATRQVQDADEDELPEVMDTEIVAIACSMERARELAVGYTCEVFEIAEEDRPTVEAFTGWLSEGGAS